MARKKVQYTEQHIQEANEIIKLKFKDIKYVPSKITYNNVCEFNKKIANTPKYTRHNGELFNLYKFDFWCNCYNGTSNLGRQLIDDFKALHDMENVIDDYSPSIKLVIAKINELTYKPHLLSKYIEKTFNESDTKITKLESENEHLKSEVKKLTIQLNLMQQAIYNIFYNSSSSRNSLVNMMNLNRSEDDFAKHLILSTFKSEDELIKLLKNDTMSKDTLDKNNDDIISIEEQRGIRLGKLKKYNLLDS